MHIAKKKKPLDTSGLSDIFSNWQHTILICGEWQGGLSKGVEVIQENRRKRYLKRWKGEEKLCQNTNISLMCLPTHEAIGEWYARRAVRQGTEGRTFSPHCHLNLSAILHFMSPLSPNIIWLIPRYTNMALLESFYKQQQLTRTLFQALNMLILLKDDCIKMRKSMIY